MKKKSDDEAASLIEIIERRMTAPVEAAKEQPVAVVVAEEVEAAEQPDVELVEGEQPAEAESFEAALEQSMAAAEGGEESEQIEVEPEAEMSADEVAAAEEVAAEEMAEEGEAAAEEPVFTPDQALELFRVTHGGEYDPQSSDHVKKMAEIEETLVDMGGLGEKSPSRFALDIYRKYKY